MLSSAAGSIIHLNNNFLRLAISKQGGSIVEGHMSDGRPFLRPYLPAVKKTTDLPDLDVGCFPLIPFGNRASSDPFEINDQLYHLKQNSPIDPLYIHGEGWLSTWDIIKQNEYSVSLSLDHKVTTHAPYVFHATQNITLHDSAVKIDMSVTNKSQHIMPFGLGQHPFFPRTAKTTLKAMSHKWWQVDDQQLPTFLEKPPTAYDFTCAKTLPMLLIDKCYIGWNHMAEIIWPENDLKMHLTADKLFDHFMIYAPLNENFFCFEPMSHAIGAIHMADLGGLKLLQPNQCLTGSITMRMSSLSSSQ